MLQKYLHRLLDVDWGNQNLNCRCVSLCAREAACVTILCEVQEEQTFLRLLLVSCEIDAGGATPRVDEGTLSSVNELPTCLHLWFCISHHRS